VEVASNDDCLVRYQEPRFRLSNWKAAAMKLASINQALEMLSLVQRTNRPVEPLDDRTVANLNYLLLRLRKILQDLTVQQVWDCFRRLLLEYQSGRWHQYKYGGDKWCSEFSGVQRPLSTTWPWSIRPCLAVLWGVCWMFEMKIKAEECQWSDRRQPWTIEVESAPWTGTSEAPTCTRSGEWFLPLSSRALSHLGASAIDEDEECF